MSASGVERNSGVDRVLIGSVFQEQPRELHPQLPRQIIRLRQWSWIAAHEQCDGNPDRPGIGDSNRKARDT